MYINKETSQWDEEVRAHLGAVHDPEWEPSLNGVLDQY